MGRWGKEKRRGDNCREGERGEEITDQVAVGSKKRGRVGNGKEGMMERKNRLKD